MLKFFLKMSENDALREYLRANGRKGAAATKRRYADDPSYYRSLGKRGGVASGASRRAKTAARAESASELHEPGGPASKSPASNKCTRGLNGC
jgi:general stress protein YciG